MYFFLQDEVQGSVAFRAGGFSNLRMSSNIQVPSRSSILSTVLTSSHISFSSGSKGSSSQPLSPSIESDWGNLGHSFFSKWQPGECCILIGLSTGSSRNTGKEDGIIIIGLVKSEPASRIRVSSQTTWLLRVRGSITLSL